MPEKKDARTDSGTESVSDSVEQTPEETPQATPVEEPEAVDAAVTPEGEPAAADADAPAAEPEAAPETEAPSEPEAPVEAPAAPPAVSGPKPKRRRLPRSERHKHSKPVREKPAKRKRITRTPKPDTTPAVRQERRGIVVSDKGEKTIVVKVDVTKLHPKYKKVVRRTRKFHAHDEQNAAGIGDVVRIVESRPISKTKNWRLAEIVEKAR